MRRRYMRELYTERVARIKQIMPHACIGVDVIVGFPGETDAEFLETYNFINSLNISYLHVFTYSERPNTDAINLPGTVPIAVRKERNKMLRILSTKKQHNFYSGHIGSTRKVLFEAENKNGFIHGFTDNYIKVQMPFADNLINNMQDVYLQQINEAGLVSATPFVAAKTLVSK